MLNWFYSLLARITGKNSINTPVKVILEQLTEPRPLPQGMKEFEEWSTRIISGALCEADPQSQKFALAEMILHLGPQECHKPDSYFIHSLRKTACNQIAINVMKEIRDEAKARLAAEEASKTPPEVLAQAEATQKRIEAQKANKVEQ